MCDCMKGRQSGGDHFGEEDDCSVIRLQISLQLAVWRGCFIRMTLWGSGKEGGRPALIKYLLYASKYFEK